MTQAQFNATGVYAQDFGTAAIAAWTNNSTFKGWYMNTTKCDYQGTVDVVTAAPTDAGGLYSYQSNNTGPVLLGFRPSDSKPGGPCAGGTCSWDGTATTTNGYACYIGLRLKNYSNLAAQSLQISCDWYQLSLADNDGTVNTDYVDYQIGTTESDPTSGTWIQIPALSFTAPKLEPNNGNTSGQLNGYPWTGTGADPQTLSVSTLLVVTVPAGKEIMIRWYDPNNSDDDPHMAFGNVSVSAFSNTTGSIPLPISLTDFEAQYNQDSRAVDLYWTTATEVDNKSFTIEKTMDGTNWVNVVTLDGAGNSNHDISYTATDDSPYIGTSYYRIEQTDFDGNVHYPGGPVAVEVSNLELRGVTAGPSPANKTTSFTFYSPNTGTASLSIYNNMGQLVSTEQIAMEKGTTTTEFNVTEYPTGMYYVVVNNGLQQFSSKFIVNHNQ